MDIVEQGIEIVKEFQHRSTENAAAVTNADRRYANTDYDNYGVELCPCEHTPKTNESPCCVRCRCSINDVVKYHNEMCKTQSGAVVECSSAPSNSAAHNASSNVEPTTTNSGHDNKTTSNMRAKARDIVADPELVQLMNKYIPPPKGESCPICGGRRVYARLPARAALPIGAKRKEEYVFFKYISASSSVIFCLNAKISYRHILFLLFNIYLI